MLQTLTKVQINDNSGVKIGKCIKILKKKQATIGDILLISVTELKKYSKLKIKKKTIFKGLVINTKKEHKYKDHTFIKFDSNQIVLINSNNNLVGSRVLGIINKTLRQKKFIKILTQATYLI